MDTERQHSFQPVHRTRASMGVVEQVQDLLVSGRIRPGERLPSERELAELFQVGRTTVREAIRTLEALGLVRAQPGSGTYLVGAPDAPRPENAILALPYASWDRQHKLFEVRVAIEPTIATLAARRASSAQVERLGAVLQEQEARVASGEKGVEQDTQFHHLLAEASGNEVFLDLLRNLMDVLKETRATFWSREDRPQRSVKQHRLIFQAVESHDAEAAERHMRDHIREVEELVLSLPH
jgi:GntR family transcriptional repressor for pyruvate dehydrogenase complex